MPDTTKWPKVCTLMGCQNAHKAGHHHHMAHGHLKTHACTCRMIGEPGTRPKEDGSGGVLAQSSGPMPGRPGSAFMFVGPNASGLMDHNTHIHVNFPYVGERISSDGLVGV